jgi:hypothetical protein
MNNKINHGEKILSFHGPLTIGLLSFVGNYLKLVINTDQVLASRLYKIFIELTQNVSYYSSEVKEIEKGIKSGVGWFLLNEYSKHFIFTTGNLIKKEDGHKLSRNCNEINSLNEEELRLLKRRTRGEAKIRDIGAHIGLIQTGLLSGHPLDFKISDINSKHSYFTISVRLDK